MKDIRIDFTQSEPCVDTKQLGEYGEAGVERFAITPPADMRENEKITNYIVAFATVRGPVRLPAVPKADVIYVAVEEACEGGVPFAIQLEGHDDTDTLIMKTPMVKGLNFAESVPEGNILNPDGKQSSGHFHRNYDLLNKISEDDGELVYNGKKIGSVITKTLEFTAENGELMVFTDHSISGSVHFLVSDRMPVGVKIASVELKYNSADIADKWYDVNSLFDESSGYYPTIVKMNESFYENTYMGVCVAIMYYINDYYDKFYNAAQYGEVAGIRVTYYDESEDA